MLLWLYNTPHYVVYHKFHKVDLIVYLWVSAEFADLIEVVSIQKIYLYLIRVS